MDSLFSSYLSEKFWLKLGSSFTSWKWVQQSRGAHGGTAVTVIATWQWHVFQNHIVAAKCFSNPIAKVADFQPRWTPAVSIKNRSTVFVNSFSYFSFLFILVIHQKGSINSLSYILLIFCEKIDFLKFLMQRLVFGRDGHFYHMVSLEL